MSLWDLLSPFLPSFNVDWKLIAIGAGALLLFLIILFFRRSSSTTVVYVER